MNLLPCNVRKLTALAFSGLCLVAQPCLADDEGVPPERATVTVLKAAKHCFDALVEVSGTLIAKNETMVRPDRPGFYRSVLHASPAGQFIRPRDHQDGPELRRRGAAHRDPVRQRRYRGPGGAARPR